MIQRRSRPRFPSKALKRLLVAGDVVGQEFECDEPSQLRVFGFVHHAHAAAPQLFDNVVMRNGLPDHSVAMLGKVARASQSN